VAHRDGHEGARGGAGEGRRGKLKDLLIEQDLGADAYRRRLKTICETTDHVSGQRQQSERHARKNLAVALSARGERPSWTDGIIGLALGTAAQVAYFAATTRQGLSSLAHGDNPGLTFLEDGVWTFVYLPLLGLLFGLFHPCPAAPALLPHGTRDAGRCRESHGPGCLRR
jgi:hypothetical protein